MQTDFLSRCNQYQLSTDESLVMAIILKNDTYVDDVLIPIIDFDTFDDFEKKTNYDNVGKNIDKFYDLLNPEYGMSYNPKNFTITLTHLNTNYKLHVWLEANYFKSFKKFISHIAIEACNSYILSVLLSHDLFGSCYFAILSENNIKCFNSLIAVCDFKQNGHKLIECLYKGMLLVDTDAVKVMVQYLSQLDNHEKIIKGLYAHCLLNTYSYGAKCLKEQYNDLCSSVQNSINQEIYS